MKTFCTLDQYKSEFNLRFEEELSKKHHYTNVICKNNDCDGEYYYKGNVINTSYPASRTIVCDKCGDKDYLPC